jgi:hypothetical protein
MNIREWFVSKEAFVAGEVREIVHALIDKIEELEAKINPVIDQVPEEEPSKNKE